MWVWILFSLHNKNFIQKLHVVFTCYLWLIFKFVWWSETLKCDKHAKKKKKIRKGANTFSHHCIYILYIIFDTLCITIYDYIQIMENTLLIRDTYMLYHVTVCEHVRFVWVLYVSCFQLNLIWTVVCFHVRCRLVKDGRDTMLYLDV